MTATLLLLADAADAPPRMLAEGPDGTWSPLPVTPAPGSDAIVVVPATHVRIDWLDLPARHLPQAQAAARALLRDRVAGGFDAAHVAVAPSADGPRACAVVDAARMQAWMDRLASLGVRPLRVVPDALCLPDDDRVRVLDDGADRILRGPGLAARLEAELAAIVLGDAFDSIDAPDTPGAATWNDIAAGAPHALDLLQPPYANSNARRTRGWGLAAVLAVLLVTSPAWIAGAQALWAHAQARTLEWQAATLATRVQPGVARDGAVRALAAHAGRLRNAARLEAVLAQLSVQAARMPGLQVDALDQRADGEVRLALSHPDGTPIDGIARALAAAGFDATPGDTRRADGRVQIELLLTPTETTR